MNRMRLAGAVAATAACMGFLFGCGGSGSSSGDAQQSPPPTSNPPPSSPPPPTNPPPSNNAEVVGTWTTSSSLKSSVPDLTCDDVGAVTLDDTLSGELRLLADCHGQDGRQVHTHSDTTTFKVSASSVEFSVRLNGMMSPPSCKFTGTLSGSPVNGAEGNVTCSNGLQGTWTARKGLPDVEPLPQFASVDVGDMNVCALATDGRLFCWGQNSFGQLGTGDTRPSLVPVHSAVGFTFKKVSVSTGGSFVCGISTAGKAYCWGNRWGGRMGDGRQGADWEIATSPVPVAGDHVFIDIATGGDHVCAVAGDGAAYCWGYNRWGQLGIGPGGEPNVPTAVAGGLKFRSITAHVMVTCGVTVSGDAYCWGNDAGVGVLGSGVEGFSAVPSLVQGGLSFDKVSLSNMNACGITTGGEAYCWGYNGSGELGIGRISDREPQPVVVTGGHAWKSISAGIAVACGVATDGRGYCWGGNSWGERGDGPAPYDDRPRAEPAPVYGELSFDMVDLDWMSCGISAGRAYCWGPGFMGGLGDGSLRGKGYPLPVAGG